MSDNINDMNFKQLRNEVQNLRDELAIFKRKYEDIIYNLDSDNFGRAFTAQQNDMKAQIKLSADAIKTKVSETDLQTELLNYSSITQTAQAIKTVVSKKTELSDAVEIDSIDKAVDKSKTYVIRQKNDDGEVLGEKYYYYNTLTNTWEVLEGDNIYTVFDQTSDGFSLKGNVVIDGDAVVTKNLKLSGNVTWDMENSPVLTQYSSDNVNWHTLISENDMYMRMSFDGGASWSNPTKVVGTDGQNGTDAYVTSENVFNALTDNGAQQGIFAAFVNKNNCIYINAEYLATKIANVSDYLYIGNENDSGTKQIIFSSGARISTFLDATGTPPTGMSISASTLQLGSKLDLSKCNSINWGNNKPHLVFS